MTDAATILKMIEEVDPKDAGKMDEIDARFWCFNNGHSYIEGKGHLYTADSKDGVHLYTMRPEDRVTRSRDSLKAIRPEGYGFLDVFHSETGGSVCQIHSYPGDINIPNTPDTWLPTEELAELHAIIQAIEYERSNK